MLNFSADSKHFVTVFGSQVNMYNAKTFELEKEFESIPYYAFCAAISKDQKLVACCNNDSIHIFDVDTKKCI